MSVEIRRWTDGTVIYTAENAQDVRAAVREAVAKEANLRYADLRYADLRYADLRYADLSSADLRYADLSSADLRSADLSSADLRSANLLNARGHNPYATNHLLILQHQVGKIRAYKLVNAEGEGPFNGGITYEIGKTYEVKDANCDPEQHCGAGINLATLPWCMAEWREGYRILLCEFTAKDIAAIPTGDGKFRTHRCKVVKELDLAEIGLLPDRGRV